MTSFTHKLKNVFLLFVLVFPLTSLASDLDSDQAEVTLIIGLFASITNLDDFSLEPVYGLDGNKNTIYEGFDMYNLDSNGPVRVSLSGDNLSNGEKSVLTVYSLDDGGIEFETAIDSTHSAEHKVSARVELGEISDQLAGDYASIITLTVSAI